MIDKKIFYCWFGNGEMSELNKKCMATWTKVCPDYEIIRIDESNFDWESNPYAKQGYEAGNWSAVSNAARLEFLKNHSGFYLDTDIQLVKSLDELRVLDGGFMTEFESSQPDSGVLGRGSVFPEYYAKAYKELIPGTVLHKNFIRGLFEKYNVHGQSFETFDDGFTILGEEYFPSIRTGLFTPNTIGIHYFENTWANNRTEITDPFYPYARVKVYFGNKLIHQDDKAYVRMLLKNAMKKWNAPDILGKCNYFFNPRVVKLSCKDFEAERMDYNQLQPKETTITASGMIVTWLK